MLSEIKLNHVNTTCHKVMWGRVVHRPFKDFVMTYNKWFFFVGWAYLSPKHAGSARPTTTFNSAQDLGVFFSLIKPILIYINLLEPIKLLDVMGLIRRDWNLFGSD